MNEYIIIAISDDNNKLEFKTSADSVEEAKSNFYNYINATDYAIYNYKIEEIK